MSVVNAAGNFKTQFKCWQIAFSLFVCLPFSCTPPTKNVKKNLSIGVNLWNCVKTFNLFLAVVAISASFSLVFVVIYLFF